MTATTETRRIACAIYTRTAIADPEELALERDLVEACIHAYCREPVTILPDRYEDDGASGNTTDRPGLRRLMADVAAGKIGRVVVERFDRLARDQAVFAELVAYLRKHGVELVSNSVKETEIFGVLNRKDGDK